MLNGMAQVDEFLASRSGSDGNTLMLLHQDSLIPNLHPPNHQQPELADQGISERLVADIVARNIQTKALPLYLSTIGKFDFKVKLYSLLHGDLSFKTASSGMLRSRVTLVHPTQVHVFQVYGWGVPFAHVSFSWTQRPCCCWLHSVSIEDTVAVCKGFSLVFIPRVLMD